MVLCIRGRKESSNYFVESDVLISSDIADRGIISDIITQSREGPIIIISASPFYPEFSKEMKSFLETICLRSKRPVLWCNSSGKINNEISIGSSMISTSPKSKPSPLHLHRVASSINPMSRQRCANRLFPSISYAKG